MTALPIYFALLIASEATLFASGAVTTTNGIAFSTDGQTLYVSNPIEREFDNGRSFAGIFVSRYVSGSWTAPQPLEWGWTLDAYHPVLSVDNERLFFNSRSDPDAPNESKPHDIWMAQRTADGWSTPERVDGVNSPRYDSYPSLARNQNLYFNSDREGGQGGMDIYLSRFVDGAYREPINLEALNSPDAENDLVVDPDETFIIFNRYFEETRELDLFVSFKEAEGWSAPRPLDTVNRPDRWELTPSLSPDGNDFLFEVERQIFRIDLSVVLSP